MVDESERERLSVMLAVGCIANLALVLCLAHTWKHWRQVKWYMVLLAVANWLDVVFRFGVDLGWRLTEMWEGTEGSCKFLMFLRAMGSSLAAMSLAALSLHVLLTAITGCQGDRLRHMLVIGLFVLLSLPLPLSMIPMFQLINAEWYGRDGQQCMSVFFFEHQYQREYFTIGASIALFFFPVFVFICCGIGSAVLLLGAGRGNVKGDESASDLVISGLLGAVLLVCCLPFYTYHLVAVQKTDQSVTQSQMDAEMGLAYLERCRTILSPIVMIVFAYVHAYRNRGEGYIPPVDSDRAASGERQKLVK